MSKCVKLLANVSAEAESLYYYSLQRRVSSTSLYPQQPLVQANVVKSTFSDISIRAEKALHVSSVKTKATLAEKPTQNEPFTTILSL